jgi:hypothetical protein
MRKILLAGVAIFLGLSSSGLANPEPGSASQLAPQCAHWPAAIKMAQMNNPGALLVKVFDGSVAQDFVRFVNTLPPASNMDGNRVALFYRSEAQQFIVLIGQGECASYVVELPSAVVAAMVGQEV